MSIEKYGYLEGRGINFSKLDSFQKYLQPHVIQAMEKIWGETKTSELIRTINRLAIELTGIVRTLRADKDVQEKYIYEEDPGRFVSKSGHSLHILPIPQLWFANYVNLINIKKYITGEDLYIFEIIKQQLQDYIINGKLYMKNIKDKGVMVIADYGLIEPLTKMSKETDDEIRKSFDEAKSEALDREAAHQDSFFQKLEQEMQDFMKGGDKGEDKKKE